MIELFTDGKGKQIKEQNLLIEELYRKVGQINVELDWLKKKLDLPVKEKVMFIEQDNRRYKQQDRRSFSELSALQCTTNQRWTSII